MVDVETSKHDFVEAISRLCEGCNNFFAEVVTSHHTDLHRRWTSTELMHPESEMNKVVDEG